MTPSMMKRLEELEAAMGLAPAVQVIWGEDNVEARISELVAASPDDRFVTVIWASGPEVPMGAARWDIPRSEWPPRDAPPPANDV
jgi:hypothetical protein